MRRFKPHMILLLLALCIAGLAACGESPREVNVERLIQIDYKGIDGYAEPHLSLDEAYILSLIDPDGELEDLGQIEVLRGRDKEKYARKLHFFETLQYRFDESYEHLKNGDGLTVIVSQDEEVSEDSRFYLDRREFDRKVTGLPEGEPVDFGKAYILELEGFDGDGTASLNENAAFKDRLNLPFELTLSKDKKLSNDETVTVTVDYDPEAFGMAGYVVPEDKLEHTVAGLMPLTLLDADTLWQGIKIDFTGFAPYLELELDNSLPETYRDLFTLMVEGEERDFYGIGDTVRLKLDFDSDKLDELKAVGYDCEEECFKKEIEIQKEEVDYFIEDIAEVTLEDLELDAVRDADDTVPVAPEDIPDEAWWLVLQPAAGEEESADVPHNALILVYEVDDVLVIREISGIAMQDGEMIKLYDSSDTLLVDVKTDKEVKAYLEELQSKGDYEVTDVTDAFAE